MSLSLEEIEALEHSFIGPTWERNEDGSWRLPEFTLGWQIAAWCAEYLQAADGGPWRFTLEQLRFVLWWYATDSTGRFIYRTGVLQRCKGWGKDPLLAVICLVEFVGPSRPKRGPLGNVEFGPDGHPVAEPCRDAWVQVTAVNQSQTDNTMGFIPTIVTPKLIETYGIKDGSELWRAHNARNKLQAVTNNYRAMEGKRTTFTLLNETHHWVEGKNGHDMYETIDGNATKMSSRYLAITNAYLPGENSVAEAMRIAWQAVQDGRAADVGFLYDSIEAHPATPLTPEALRVVLPIIRGDAHWLDTETTIQAVLNTAIKPARSRRMYLNQVVAEEDALYDEGHWKAMSDGNDELMLSTNDEIVLGFDGGKTDDATALVAIRIRDAAVFVRHLQEKPPGPEGDDWEVDRQRVDSAVHETFRLHKVRAFYADVALWESYIDDWAETYRERLTTKATGTHAVAWDMRRSKKMVTTAHERLVQAIFDGRLKASPLDTDIRRHMLNVYRHENEYGVSFRKQSRESSRKIDIYAALMLAHEAYHDHRTRGATKERERTGRVWGF